jgi:acetolactate synthase-1/2/3 large subunit
MKNKISLILHDECHNTSSERCNDFLIKSKGYNIPIVGFSATPLRTGKDDKSKLLDIYGDPNNKVVLIAGDGGFQMNIQELQTVAHHQIPLKIFILNNNGYLAISLMQDNLFNSNYLGSTPESGVSSPNFCAISNAYGIKSFRFGTNHELENNIQSVLDWDGPAICEIIMPEHQLLIPRVQSKKDETGKITSVSIENMFPFLPDKELKDIMS